MNLKLLADTLTTFLAPAMPYLVSGGGELIQEAGKKLGEGAPEIRKILEADSSLAAEIAKPLEAAGPKTTYQAEVHGSGAIAQGKSVAAGAGGIAAGRDVRKVD
jgi:hypothetical protein